MNVRRGRFNAEAFGVGDARDDVARAHGATHFGEDPRHHACSVGACAREGQLPPRLFALLV